MKYEKAKKKLKLRKPVKFRLFYKPNGSSFGLIPRASLLDLSPEGNLPLLTAGRSKKHSALLLKPKLK